MAAKKDSKDRWKQMNCLVDHVCPQLKSGSQVAVLLTCFRHGMGMGFFRVSTRRIAKSAKVDQRYVRRILNEFEAIGLIDVHAPQRGTIPKTYRIRFERQPDGEFFVDYRRPETETTPSSILNLEGVPMTPLESPTPLA